MIKYKDKITKQTKDYIIKLKEQEQHHPPKSYLMPNFKKPVKIKLKLITITTINKKKYQYHINF